MTFNLFFSALENFAKTTTMWKEEAVTFQALPETKGFDSSIEHALSLLEDSPVAESNIPEPVRPMTKASSQTTLVDSIFCDRYCADVNKHTEHCVTRSGFLVSSNVFIKKCFQTRQEFFTNYNAEQEAKKMRRKWVAKAKAQPV